MKLDLCLRKTITIILFIVTVIYGYMSYRHIDEYHLFFDILTLPLIMALYLIDTKVYNKMYLLILLLTALGDGMFSSEVIDYDLGLFCFGLGLFLYAILLFVQMKKLNVKTMIIILSVFAVVYLTPYFFFYENIPETFINSTLFYTTALGFFMIACWVVYFTNKSLKHNKYVLLASICLVLMTVFYGIFLFKDYKYEVLETFGIIFTFMLCHYFMYKYMIAQEEYNVRFKKNREY